MTKRLELDVFVIAVALDMSVLKKSRMLALHASGVWTIPAGLVVNGHDMKAHFCHPQHHSLLSDLVWKQLVALNIAGRYSVA